MAHAHIIAIAGQPVADLALGDLLFGKWFDHVPRERHLANPTVGFDGHASSTAAGCAALPALPAPVRL